MAKALAGEAAIRIVPTLRGFKPEADRRLREMTFNPVEVRIDPDLKRATAQMTAWRERQRLNAINVPVKADFKDAQKSLALFTREITTVEHVFKRSSLSKAIRLNVKVFGLDALPALAYAAGSATTAIDALGKSLFLLPGLVGGAMASVGAFAIGMRGISDAFKAYGEETKNSAQHTRDVADANRQIQRSYRDYRSAVRDTVREIQDLNAENRRSSLNVADAVLGVQEAADKLRKGGQNTLLEYRRDQLSYAQAVERLQEVRTKAARTSEDVAEANAKGVDGADRVVDALDAIRDATERLDKTNTSKVADELAKLAPNAAKAVEAAHSLSGAWTKLQQSVQNNLWDGIDKTILDLGQKTLPGLEIGLSRVASGLNANFRSIGESLGQKENGDLMGRIFGNTGAALDRLSAGMDPLINGILRLTKEGTDFLPRLGDAAAKVFGRFDAWTERISKDGSLDKWIDDGLNALTDLGNAAANIGSIISSVADAFTRSGGPQGGLISTLRTATEDLANFLKSADGKQKLIDYFDRARELIGKIKDAIKDMRPFISDAVDVARDWSVVLLGAAGALLKIGKAIEDHTGLLKVMLGGYLLLRTTKPIFDMLTGGWKLYTKAVLLASETTMLSAIPGIKGAADGIRKFRGEVDEAGDAQVAAADKAKKAAAGQATATVSSNASLAAAVQRQVTAYDNLGNRIEAATTKVGNLQRATSQLSATPIGSMASTVSARGDEAARREAAGFGLGTGTLRERLDRANASYAARQAARGVSNETLGTDRSGQAMQQAFMAQWGAQNDRARLTSGGPVGGDLAAARRLSADLANQREAGSAQALLKKWESERNRAGIGLSPVPLPQRLENARDVAAIRRAFAQPAEYRSRGFDPAMRGANLAPWRGGGSLVQPETTPTTGSRWQGPLTAAPKGSTSYSKFFEVKSSGMGAMQGPALPPGFAGVGPTDLRSGSRLGPMQGPQLSAGMLQALSREARQAGPPIATLGQNAIKSGAGIKDVGTQAKFSTYTTADLNRQISTANQRFPVLAQVASGIPPVLNDSSLAAGTASSKLATVSDETRKLAQVRFPSLLQVTSNIPPALNGVVDTAGTASSRIKDLGNEASTAASKVGGTSAVGGIGASLWGSFKSLGSAMLPGAALMAGFVLVTAAVDKLGEAHRNAARDAKLQDDALKNLATTLDSTTGAFTAQTLDESLRTFKKPVPIPGVDQNFVPFDAFQRLGWDPRTTAITAGAPNQSDKFNEQQKGWIDQLTKDLEGTDLWKNNASNFGTYGISSRDVIMAGIGDPGAQKKVQQAIDNPQMESVGDEFGSQQAITFPDLAKVANALPNKDLFGAAQVLTQNHQTNLNDAQNNLAISQTRSGKRELGAPAQILAPFEPDLGSLTTSVSGEGVVQLNKDPGPQLREQWRNQFGVEVSDQPNPTGQWIATIPAGITDQWLPAVPGYADGGLVRGPGGPRDDAILAKVSNYEHITNADAVRYYGTKLFDDLNAKRLPRLAGGGWPLSPAPVTPFDPAPLPINQAATPAPPVAPPAPALAPPAATTATERFSTPVSRTAPLPPTPAPTDNYIPPTASYIPPTGLDLSGSGALPDTESSARSKAPGATIPNANILGYLQQVAGSQGLAIGSGADTNHGGTHNPDGGQHSMNRALDIGNSDQAKSGAISAFVRQWMSDPAKVAATRQLIFNGPDGPYGIINGRILSGDELQAVYGGDLPAHGNHAHLALEGVPASMQNGLQGLVTGKNGELLNGERLSPMELVKKKWDNLFSRERWEARYAKAYDPANVFKFLGGQASAVGSALLGIGSQFLSGITGINFGSVLGPLQEVGNWALGDDDDDSEGGDGSDVAGMALDQYASGAGGIGDPLNAALDAFNPTGGGGSSETRKSVYKAFLEAGFPNSEWNALDKLLAGESSWDPTISNKDSGAFGLFQFLGHENDQYGALGGYSRDPYQQATAGMRYIKDRYGTPSNAYNKWLSRSPHWYAKGGITAGGNAWLSNGEYRTGSGATKYYGAGLFNALNSKAIPRDAIQRFAEGGWPLLQPQPVPGQTPGPLDLGAPAPAPAGPAPAPAAGGAPGPGATAPAPDPGALPAVQDAMSSIGGLGGSIGGAGGSVGQPGASPTDVGDPRAVFGASPTSNDHNNPALSGAIQGAAGAIGGLAGMAASMGLTTVGGPAAGGAGGAGIQAGAQIAGSAITGGLNILSSLLVGTATSGSTQSASGVPLLPDRQQMQTGVPQINAVDNRQYHVTNLDEFKRVQATSDAQAAMPFIGKY
ncbi:tail length tape measure protein [Mycobacterium phage Rey]|uniref:Tape measure protein n=1 Tax=Mycobacterium phage Rey TaxID=1034115 RepID=G1D592_9CAUD|nr:tail length tape measure protein [Mycobacterium phage Rey]AEK09942.1 tape measure protein [Mycobacterium phage Rey]